MDTTQTLLTTLVVMLSVLSAVLLAVIIAVGLAIRNLSKKIQHIVIQSSDLMHTFRRGTLKTTGAISTGRILWKLVRRKAK
jgi:aromatic ring-opening dioxygenase catalytic subunit (LigB family)